MKRIGDPFRLTQLGSFSANPRLASPLPPELRRTAFQLPQRNDVPETEAPVHSFRIYRGARMRWAG